MDRVLSSTSCEWDGRTSEDVAEVLEVVFSLLLSVLVDRQGTSKQQAVEQGIQLLSKHAHSLMWLVQHAVSCEEPGFKRAHIWLSVCVRCVTEPT
jgi:hypothetical protein